MSRRDAAVLGLRVLGIWAWIRMLEGWAGILAYGATDDPTPYTSIAERIAWWSHPILLGAVGALLVFLARPLSYLALPATEEEDAAITPASPTGLMDAAYAVIGVLLVLLTLEDLGRLIVYGLTVAGLLEGEANIWPYRSVWILALFVLAQVGVGVWLFLRGTRLTAWWQGLRGSGPSRAAS
jgi:hypothetical protein